MASFAATAGLGHDRAQPIPWLVRSTAFASTVFVAGFLWDMSWHRSIGRDTFFTPPHGMFYFGALLACGSSGYSILRATFARPTNAVEAATIGVWGLRGQLGAFVAAWGGISMLAAAPFDNWWHAIYGLDIVILSPPHVFLLGGGFMIIAGGTLLALSHCNSTPTPSRFAEVIVLHGAGIGLVVALGSFLEETFIYLMHGANCYRVVSLVAPGILIGVARASGRRYGATAVAFSYTAFLLLVIAVLPLFPAQPRLGPVLHPVTHFVPPPFPLLILPAAMVLDWTFARLSQRPLWLQAVGCGSSFLLVFVALQWPFANFLHTSWADNRFFVANAFPYFQGDSSAGVRRVFRPTESSAVQFWLGMVGALAIAISTTLVGLGAGRWLRELRR